VQRRRTDVIRHSDRELNKQDGLLHYWRWFCFCTALAYKCN